MGQVIVIGAQWGDEGKGKIVDLLCQRAQVVVRFQGGPNAGHTVSVAGRKTFLHHIPAGILHPGRLCLLGPGMVIDPDGFLKEVAELAAAGVGIDGRLLLSDRAHLIFPHHRALDQAVEEHAEHRIGTTKRGVGYAYQSKVLRLGVRPADLDDAAELQRRLGLDLEVYEAWRPVLPSLPQLTLAGLLETAAGFRRDLAPYIADTGVHLAAARRDGRAILFEGSQGTLLDVDHGTYPFVTSSNTVAGAAYSGSGAGIAPGTTALGIYKAYATRVGEGPMPTELPDELGERLRQRGREFGTTTGRPRRCGWFDAVAARYAAEINGFSMGALMLLDVLDGFEEVKIATAFDTPKGRLDRWPAALAALRAARPVYETLPGWNGDITACRRWEDLPAGARAYVTRLEELTGVPFTLISVGPDREQTIVRDQAAVEQLLGA